MAKELVRMAKELVGYKENSDKKSFTKSDFLDYLASSIDHVTINIDFGNLSDNEREKQDGLIVASSDIDLDVKFIDLKNKIDQWKSEERHLGPFWPREFVKKLLENGCLVNYIQRKHDESKINPEAFGLDTREKVRDLIISRIMTDDENNGFKFLPNSEVAVESNNYMPIDAYSTILINVFDRKQYKVYVKFYINRNEEANMDLEFQLLSFH